MTDPQPTVQTLYDALIFELTKAFALPQTRTAHRMIEWIFGKAARRVAKIGIGLDHEIERGGLNAGARWLLPNFVKSHSARGMENIPPNGPLVIAANHPAGVDSVVISAYVTRPDYKVFIGDIPFFEQLPHLHERAIFTTENEDPPGRMRAMRESLRHLQSGGALLIFPRGRIEADPEWMPSPEGEFNLWSRSLEIFLNRVPQTRVLITMVSGVIAHASMRNPLTLFRKARPDRQRIAFLTQLARQILSGKETFGLTPRVTFGEIVSGGAEHALGRIHQSAQRVLAEHIESQP